MSTSGSVRPLLLAMERFVGEAFDRLAERYRVRVVGGPVLPEALTGEPPAALFTFRENVDEVVLARLPSLRVFANYGVGVDRLDLDALARHGVVLVRPAGANAEAVADHTFGLLIALRHRIVELDGLVRRGGYANPAYQEPLGHDVHGTTIGLVGFGAIGRAVARRARAFGMPVLYSSRRGAPGDVERALGARRVTLGELLERSDVVSLHCPLTRETRGLIGAGELARLRPGAVLVNTARGAVVDEVALTAALLDGRLAGAALDVFADEPYVPEALYGLPNVVLTPHTADATYETRARMTAVCVEGLLANAPGTAPSPS